MPITASYSSATFTLTLTGTVNTELITASRNAAGTLLVNGGAVPVSGGPATVANTDLIMATGDLGDDAITVDEANGALPSAQLIGDAGNDTLTGGSSADLLEGGVGNDTLLGRGGTDLLYGGDDNDVLTGGDGDDQMFGELGNDRMIWNPGDDSDLMEGGDGSDIAEVNGGGGAEVFTVTANGTRVRFDRVSPAPFALDIGTTEGLTVNMGGGDDSISMAGNLAALISIVVDGGVGNDTIQGSNGADVLIGGDGNDLVDGNQGNDVGFLGAGDDVFNWDPGDGSDVVEGQGGIDTLRFNGSAAAEIFDVSANGGRVLFTRNVGTIIHDLNDVETFVLNALGGIDTLTINDLAGTDAAQVVVDLASAIGGATGDGAVDTVILNGTGAADTIALAGAAGTLTATGLETSLTVTTIEATDVVRIQAGQGNDRLVAAAAGLAGAPVASFDGNDGTDTAQVDGTGGGEVFTLTANGTRVRFDRLSTGAFALDIGTTEAFVLNMGGGSDSFSAAGNLAALIGVTVDGGAGADSILGTNGADVLIGGDDADSLDGNQGNDVLFGGAGDDVFQWDPGDGSDTVEGGGGTNDTLRFNGSAANEIFALAPNGARLSLTRNVGAIVQDIDDVESVIVTALGGTDTITINDLVGTDAKRVTVNLAGTIGGTTGDGAADTVTAYATPASTTINVSGDASAITVTGLRVALTLNRAETSDRLVIFAGEGNDSVTLTGFADHAVQLDVDGGDGNDAIHSTGDGTYFGGTGDDLILAGITNVSETLNGGDGIDTLDTRSWAGAYTIDMVSGATSYSGELFINFENLITGGGQDTITGTAGANVIRTNGDVDTIAGAGGDDLIDGGAGADTMAGGTGNDHFIVDNAGDVVIEADGEGLDLVDTLVSFSLAGQFVERLRLGGSAAINGTGNALANQIVGNANANILDGGAGADDLRGRDGEDVYFVDNAGDVVTELDGEGSDLVYSTVTFSLAGQFIEVLELLGTSAINGTGNGLNNRLVGNSAANVLFGMSGNDRLDGQGGADTMRGGMGNDTYVVDNAGDVIQEDDGQGTDTVEASITYSLVGRFVEVLVLTGAANINGTGNGLANTLIGNAGNNTLNGMGGADSLRGGAGDDVLIVDNVGDTIVELNGEGYDTVQSSVTFSLAGQYADALVLTGTAAINGTGNGLANVLTGNSGANLLRGGAGDDHLHGGLGSDTLAGEAGADHYWFETAPGASNIDTIAGFVAADDTIHLDRTIFAGIAANGTLAAGAFRLGAAALDADDRILYDAATGNIWYDADGTGAAAAVLFAKVAAGTALTNADFVGEP